jgi:DNA polymerase I-like protein with 3'-5' exonuclease and polymerase domains
MNIGLFCTPDDSPQLARFQAIVGQHAIKVSRSGDAFISSVAAKIKAHGIEAIICTCPETMTTLLRALPDFRHPRDKRGLERKLSLNDYAGSFFTLPDYVLGLDRSVDVLILNPLAHLVTTAEGQFVFKRFISKITKPDGWFPQTDFTWEVWSASKSADLLAYFSQAKILSIDIETYRDDDLRRIHCVGYCGLFPDGSTHTVVVPFKDMLAHAFVRALNASPVAKLFQNGLYDNAYFARFGVPVTNWLYDTQHLFHSWYAELPKRLDFITAFSVRKVRYWKDDSAGSEFNLFEYNAKDCWSTLMAWCSLSLEVPDWAWRNYHAEFPVVFPAHHCEMDGITLNKERFDVRKAEAEVELAKQANRLQAWFGAGFNPRSPDQCKRLLTVLGMGKVESSDEKAMNAAAAVSPFNNLIVSAILEYRGQAKLLSTYFVWEKFWYGRLFYKLNPAGTDTGRLASAESSFWTGLQIQNIPGGTAIKGWLACDRGWDGIAEGDFSQAEARCVGYLSGCASLIDLVESSYDYHSWNAHKFFGVAYEAVTKALRNLSKRVNHGSNYNMGAAVLLETMGPKSVAEAQRLLHLPSTWTLIQVCQHLLRTYEQTYPEVKRDWYDALKREIKLTKKLVSQLGWTRWFFADPTASKPALNAAVAHGPQNLNAGILNVVFYKVWWESLYGELRGKVRIKAQIHDSILYCWRDEDTPERVRKMMEHPIQVKDIKGVVRTMLIPPDMSAFAKDKEGTVTGPAKYWSDLK